MAGEWISASRTTWGHPASHASDSVHDETAWLRSRLDTLAWLNASPWAAECRALLGETDREFFQDSLLQLAERMERSDAAPAVSFAAQIYRHLSEDSGSIAERARTRAAALAGEGSGSLRWESGLRQFARQATDPVMLASLGLASGVGTLSRAAILARFTASGRSALLGISAANLARGGALLLEAPTWVLAEEGLRRFCGGTASETSLASRLASATLGLGALRFAEGLPLNPWVAQYTGILLANRAEQSLGLRPASDWAASFGDSLVFLAQAQVAGHLSRRLLGSEWMEVQGRIDARADAMASTARSATLNWLPRFAGWEPLPAGTTRGLHLDARSAPTPGHMVFNIAHGEAPGNGNGSNGSSGARSGLIGRRLSQLAEPNFEKLKSPLTNEASAPGVRRRIGLLTSGGDGPGENAAIAALVRGASEVYGWEIAGIWDGYRGLLQPEHRVRPLFVSDIEGPSAVNAALRQIYGKRWEPDLMSRHADIMAIGGNILRSSRTNPVAGDPEALRVKATLRDHGMDGLIVLGGNGSMRAAAELDKAGVPVVFLPQSIDADVPGSELSIGFPSAVAKGVSELQHFYHTGQSCDRWFFVEVMGQHYGALSLAIAYEGRADGIFTEIARPMRDIADLIQRRAVSGQKHGVVIVSESVAFAGENGVTIEPPRGIDKNGRLLVESGDIAKWVSGQVGDMGIPHTRSAPLGYLLRGAWPSPSEIELASTLSRGALHLIAGGEWGRMVGLRFAPRSSEFEMVFPDLRTVAAQNRRLDRRLDSLVREVLEH